MKFKISFKSPDAVHTCINEAITYDFEDIVDPVERREATKERANELNGLVGRWVECGEYLTVEIDTEAETCTVVPVSG